ncbi:MAG: LAGLIDADG family homing endonuclease, partial [Phycicoccus sp.]
DALQLPDADLPVGPYTLGAWLGDGTSADGSITVGAGDEETLTEIRSEGYIVKERPAARQSGRAPLYNIAGLRPTLRTLGVLGDKHIPELYFRSSEGQRRALLAGLLDTDGWCEKWGTVRFAVTSQRLAEDVRRLVATLGHVSTMRSRPARLKGRDVGTTWEVTFCPDRPVFRMTRKVERQSVKNKASNRRRFIVNIRPVPSRPVRCITVDSPSSLYLVGEQCIPTHNTLALLIIGLTAAKDVRAKLFVFDLKGTGDLSSLAQVAHAYRVGDEPEDIAEMLEIMRELREEMRARTRLVRAMTLEENPEKGKVTDQLATRDPDRFGPIVVLVDEVQVWTQEFTEALPSTFWVEKPPKDPGKAVREEFIAIMRDLVKRGPALGIIPVLATQKPDAQSIPSSIADNASARLCLKVNGQISNDQILGTSSYQSGIRATQFAFSEKGIAYFRGDGAEPLVVRTVTMTPQRADELAAQARSLRLAAGRLTGEAADDGITDVEVVIDILEDVERVLRDRSRGRAHHVELVEWLRELRPENYGELDVEELSARLRGAGVRIDQFKQGGSNRRGVHLSSVVDQRERDDDDDG